MAVPTVAFADLSAAKLADLANDKPLIVGDHVLRDNRNASGFAASWRRTGSGGFGDTDDTNALYPVANCYDNGSHTYTKNTTADAQNYLCFNFGSAGASFDSFALIRHNLDSFASMTVSLQVADNSAFTSNLRTIASWSPGTSTKRLVSVKLFHTGSTPQLYSDVQYARVKFDGTAGLRHVGQVIFGTRRQLKHAPSVPYDDGERRSNVERLVSSSGVVTSYTYYRGQRRINARINPNAAPYTTDMRAFFDDDTDHGTQPFLWLETPNSDPQNAAWCYLDDPSWSMPVVGPAERDVRIQATEQGPHFVDLEA